tara:strand:+ start:1280 stop:1903 length:624 start_codon:yes stop_codon:yes gene_type:complete
MKLDVVRTQFGADATNSLLFIDGEFECYGLEDEIRDVKVYAESAIPLGEYEIKFRTVGGFHTRTKARYDSKYGEGWHLGMLELQDVPNFEFILVHSGNTDESTAGCYLVGNTQQDLDVSKDGFIGSSRVAYEKMYPKVRDALVAGEKVTIKYSNINLNEIIEEVVSEGIDNKSGPTYMNPADVQEKLQEISGEIQVLTAMLKGRLIN